MGSVWWAEIALKPLRRTPFKTGLLPGSDHIHVFRNQTVGKRWSDAASGPLFETLILIARSSAPPLAYSTRTSKYLSWSNTPVSSNSYSGAPRPRFLFV